MPPPFKDLPPDHPIFSMGPSFLLKNELLDVTPAEEEIAERSEEYESE